MVFSLYNPRLFLLVLFLTLQVLPVRLNQPEVTYAESLLELGASMSTAGVSCATFLNPESVPGGCGGHHSYILYTVSVRRCICDLHIYLYTVSVRMCICVLVLIRVANP